jgi:hypothetical protein
MGHHHLRFHTYLVAFLICPACRSGTPAATLHVAYPELLRQAAVSGFFHFRVGLDSTGAPDLRQFRVLESPNPGFDFTVKRAVAAWRPQVALGTSSVEHAILFVVLPHGADSSRACPPARGYTVVCRTRPSILADTVPVSVSH